MANWQTRLDIADIHKSFKSGELTPTQVCAKVAERMAGKREEVKKVLDKFEPNLIDIWDEIVETLKEMGEDATTTIDEYDGQLAELYDLADTHLRGDFLSGDKLCWVNTF